MGYQEKKTRIEEGKDGKKIEETTKYIYVKG